MPEPTAAELGARADDLITEAFSAHARWLEALRASPAAGEVAEQFGDFCGAFPRLAEAARVAAAVAAEECDSLDGDEWSVCFYCGTSMEGLRPAGGFRHTDSCTWARARFLFGLDVPAGVVQPEEEPS